MPLQEKLSGAEIQVVLQRVSVLQHQSLSRNKKYLLSCLLTVALTKDSMGRVFTEEVTLILVGQSSSSVGAKLSPHDSGLEGGFLTCGVFLPQEYIFLL